MIKLIAYAVMNENVKVKAVSLNDFNSLFIVIILDKHGKYNNEKTTNEITVGIEKLPEIPPEATGYRTDKVETIISFAPTPTIRDEAACHVPKPSGANICAITLEINAIILSFISAA